jgi:methionine-rich copper-binding protein CopC
MMAPISGNPCFLHRTTVWQQRMSESQKWRKIAEETLHLPFFIEDATGQLPIHPPGADLDLLREFREEYDTWTFSPAVFSQEEDSSQNQDRKNTHDLLPASVLVFLSCHGIVPDHRLRIEECLIKPNDILFVAGTLMENPDAQHHPLSQGSDVNCGVVHPDSGNHASDHNSDQASEDDSRNDDSHTDSPLDPAPNPLSEPLPAPQVIRLAAGAAASSSSHMTQQGKITAALTRAGIPEAAAWSAAEIPHPNPNVDVENNAPPAAIDFAHSDALRQENEVPRIEAELNRADRNNVTTNGAETNTVHRHEVRVREAPSNEELSNEELSDEEHSNDGLSRSAPVSLMKGVDDPMFVISFRSQKEFCSALARKSAAMLWGGAAMTMVGVCMLLAQFAIH